MGTVKNSIKWLKPIELSFEASKKFERSIEQPLDAATKKRQISMIEAARKINR